MNVGYARVSTFEQNPDLQHEFLKQAECDKIFTDHASGAKADRPALTEALAYVRSGDCLVVWRLDRLGRSLKHLIEVVEDLESRKVMGISRPTLYEYLKDKGAGGKRDRKRRHKWNTAFSLIPLFYNIATHTPIIKEDSMAFKVHKIMKYNYAFDARSGGPGRLQLWGEKGIIADIRFVDDSGAVPPPNLSPDLESATASMKQSALIGLIDMLRNEEPVSVTINDQPPGFVFIHTGLEPAGEGEIKL